MSIPLVVPLKRQQNIPEAQKLLEKLNNHVVRIMKKRNWKVGSLHEFYPTNPNLLGVNINRGKQIKIRLRQPYDNNVFLDFHDLIGTMLHELTHIKFGPHDQKFYALLDEIYTEYEKDLDDGFKPDGDVLGGNHLTKEQQIKLVEKRAVLGKLMHSGGRKLGSGGKSDARNIRILVAEAAEKRARDSKWCSTNDDDVSIISHSGDTSGATSGARSNTAGSSGGPSRTNTSGSSAMSSRSNTAGSSGGPSRSNTTGSSGGPSRSNTAGSSGGPSRSTSDTNSAKRKTTETDSSMTARKSKIPIDGVIAPDKSQKGKRDVVFIDLSTPVKESKCAECTFVNTSNWCQVCGSKRIEYIIID
jgi:hypothetical protein